MLYWLADKLLIGYIYSTVLFLLLRVFNKTARERSAGYLNLANTALLICLALNLITQLMTVVDCRALRSSLPQHLYGSYGSNCYSFLIWTLILGFAFQLCFLFRKCRINTVLTVISVALLLILKNLDGVMMLITKLFRDYMPSSWSVYYPIADRIWSVIYVFVYFIVCWMIPKTRSEQGNIE